jgi:hypothetical protein
VRRSPRATKGAARVDTVHSLSDLSEERQVNLIEQLQLGYAFFLPGKPEFVILPCMGSETCH